MIRNLQSLSIIILFFLASPLTHGSHPKQVMREFEGVITAITEQSVTVQNSEGPRVFQMMQKKYVRGELWSITCVNGLSVDVKVTDVFKVGDKVAVLYRPEVKNGKEAADIWYLD